MRKSLKISAVLATAVALTLSLTACGTDSPASASADNGATGSASADGVTTIVIGASSTPHAQILEYVNDNLAAAAGIKLDIKVYDDYILPNQALASGDLDANYFQHVPYLDAQIKDQGYKFSHYAGVHYEPYGIYSDKIKNLDDLTDGAKVGVTSDPSNQARALLLLQDAKLITLADTGDVDPTLLDVKDNPKNLQFIETAPEQLARALQDVDIAVINGNFAIQAGLSPKTDSIYLESGENNKYANIVAVRTEDKDKPALVTLDKLLHSADVKAFIEKTWPNGAVLPAF